MKVNGHFVETVPASLGYVTITIDNRPMRSVLANADIEGIARDLIEQFFDD